MDRAHRHNDVELNFVTAGRLAYLFGGEHVVVPAGAVLLFWAAMPHRLVSVAPDTAITWLTLPLGLFLHWQLPPSLAAIMNGRQLLEHDVQLEQYDRALVGHWEADLRTPGDAAHAIVLLELEARLRRMALCLERGGETRGASEARPGAAERMAQLIGERYAEPLRVADIAAAVALHPNYAMHMFRRAYGVSIVAYLTQQRVAHAQRLLLTGDLSVSEVALESGFGSLSRFHDAFRDVCGTTPREYRRAVLYSA